MRERERERERELYCSGIECARLWARDEKKKRKKKKKKAHQQDNEHGVDNAIYYTYRDQCTTQCTTHIRQEVHQQDNEHGVGNGDERVMKKKRKKRKKKKKKRCTSKTMSMALATGMSEAMSALISMRSDFNRP